METFSRDAEYIFSAVGATDNANLASVLFRRHNTTTDEGGSTHESKTRTIEYFRSVDLNTKQALLKLYWLDFEMFGYDAEEYM